jgi:peptidoglycan/xylan/chitin deacetylase (PgdA/CDA1 family)
MTSFRVMTILLLLANICKAEIQIAITVDDLPGAGSLPSGVRRFEVARQFLDSFKRHHISGVYGFINADKIEEDGRLEEVLKLWVNNGHLLGNHTFSHMPLSEHSETDYITDIQRNEPMLFRWMGKKDFYWFRYPYLAEGDTHKKRNDVRTYLADHSYKVAQVSTDFSDWKWQDPYLRCLKKKDQASIKRLKESYVASALSALSSDARYANHVFKRDIKHILLIHLSPLTALVLDELLTAYEDLKVKFISLEEAESDPIYQINPNKVAQYSGTFLLQVGETKGMKYPDPPVIDLTAFCSD